MPNESGTPNDASSSGRKGVPGFPEFPELWQGASSVAGSSRKSKSWKINTARAKRQQRRVQKAAVAGTAVRNRMGKDVKQRAKDARQDRRKEKIVKLKQQRERKREVGSMCRGMS